MGEIILKTKPQIRVYGLYKNKALADEIAKKVKAKVFKKNLKTGVRYLVKGEIR